MTEPSTTSLARVYRDHAPYVHRALRRFGVRAADLEDVTQEVFIRVLNRYADYDERGSLRAWIYGVAFRVAANYFRLARNRLELVTEEAATSMPDETATERQEHARLRQQISAVLEHIPFERRAVLVLHSLEGHSLAEVSQITGQPPGRTEWLLKSARDQFKRAWVERYGV